MNTMFSAIQTVVPEIDTLLLQRLNILRVLETKTQRIGRKQLAQEVMLTERALRTVLEVLRQQKLVEVTQAGILITNVGVDVLYQLEPLVSRSMRFVQLQQRLASVFTHQQCVVIPGDVETEGYKQLAEALQDVLVQQLSYGKQVIAVTGGGTLAEVGRWLTDKVSHNRELYIVPARGGVEGSFDIQSNSVGGVMSQRLHAEYVPLFIPENVNQQMSQVLLTDPSVRYAVDMAQHADCMLLSIGTADTMAKRRDITDEQRQLLIERQAVGEAFGVFFDAKGHEVMRLPRFGIQLEDLTHIPLVVAIVVGQAKAEAVQAFYKLVDYKGWLICDESLANQVLIGATL